MTVLHPPAYSAVHERRRQRFGMLASMCRFALIEARRLVLQATSPSPLQKLVVTAEGLLEDLDDLLLALDPMRDAGEYSLAASLHRSLDELAILRRESAILQPSAKPFAGTDGIRPPTS